MSVFPEHQRERVTAGEYHPARIEHLYAESTVGGHTEARNVRHAHQAVLGRIERRAVDDKAVGGVAEVALIVVALVQVVVAEADESIF